MKKTMALLVVMAAALAGCSPNADNGTVSTTDTNVNTTATRGVNEPAGSATNSINSQTPGTTTNSSTRQP